MPEDATPPAAVLTEPKRPETHPAVDRNQPVLRLLIAAAVVGVLAAVSLFFVYRTVRVPIDAMNAIKAAVGAWGETKITVTTQSDQLGVKPIAEMAFSKVRFRAIVKYEHTRFGSTKLLIAEQVFDARLGWDMKDDVIFIPSTTSNRIRIVSPMPRLLTLTPSTTSPNILFEEEGITNRFKSSDWAEVAERLRAQVFSSQDVREGIFTAQELFERFWTGIFKLQGFEVVFEHPTDKSE